MSGSFVSSKDAWADVPDDGVLYKMIYYSDGTRQAQSGMDYYFEEETELGVTRGTGTDFDDIRTRYPKALVKRGQWVPDELWFRVRREALDSRW